MKLIDPKTRPTCFDGIPKFQSSALPPNEQTMIKSSYFPRLSFPAKFAPRIVVGEAIRAGRVE